MRSSIPALQRQTLFVDGVKYLSKRNGKEHSWPWFLKVEPGRATLMPSPLRNFSIGLCKMFYLFFNCATSISNDATCYICSFTCLVSVHKPLHYKYATTLHNLWKRLGSAKHAGRIQASKEMFSAVGCASRYESSRS